MEKASTRTSRTPVLYRAAWVFPVISEPLEDGAVLVENDRILAVGRYRDLRTALPSGTRAIDYEEAAIIPGLVNMHTHLELSVLKGKIPFPMSGFSEWLNVLFPLRSTFERHQILEGFSSGIRELLDSGTVLCGDITNGAEPPFIHAVDGFPERCILLELLGFNCESLEVALPQGVDPERNGTEFTLTPHSPYSTSPQVIAGAKAKARRLGLPFSIHASEHIEEIEFLRNGTGYCRELLEKLDRWNAQWQPPGLTPIQYLDGLGVLDSLTVLVHAVHMNRGDWQLARGRKCTICFCPRSNFNLGVGRPDIEKAVLLGIPSCLGTDSLASNTDLDLFAEAAFVLDGYSGIRPEAVLGMITLHPARALCRGSDYGSIQAGLKASLLAISIGPEKSHISEALIRKGKEGEWIWVSPPALN